MLFQAVTSVNNEHLYGLFWKAEQKINLVIYSILHDCKSNTSESKREGILSKSIVNCKYLFSS